MIYPLRTPWSRRSRCSTRRRSTSCRRGRRRPAGSAQEFLAASDGANARADRMSTRYGASPTVAEGYAGTPDVKVLMKTPSSGTGVMVSVEEERGVRTLYLDGHCQSDALVLADGSLSPAQPLELVRIMSVLTLGWAARGTSTTSDAPRVLLLGLGGGSIARVLASALPPAGRVHSVELEPEVITAAATYFGLELSEPRCTAEAGECATFLKSRHRWLLAEGAKQGADAVDDADGFGADAEAAVATEAAGAAEAAVGTADDGRYDVILLDVFDAEGLSPSARKNPTLDAAAGCLSRAGLLMINVHTGPPDDPDDPDYYIARGVLRLLCQRFDSVYSVHCSTTQNLIAVCHWGNALDADEWEGLLAAELQRPVVQASCGAMVLEQVLDHFDFVGGKDEPLSDDDGPNVPPECSVHLR